MVKKFFRGSVFGGIIKILNEEGGFMPDNGKKMKNFFSNSTKKPFGFGGQKNLLLRKPLPLGDDKKIVSISISGFVGLNRKEGLNVPSEYITASRALRVNSAIAEMIEAVKK